MSAAKKSSTASKCGLAVLAAVTLYGCRGQPSPQPPVHLNLNMDFQSNFQPQEENSFFADKRAMRMPVAGTVARGSLREDDHFNTGKSGENFVTTLPMPLSIELLKRGQDRYNIFCTPCHSRTGLGNGLVVQRGFIPAPNFHDDRIVTMPVGQYFDVISNGVRSMPAYGHAIPTDDRWAIAAYMRALQLSRHARIDDVPQDVAASKGWTK